MVVFKYYEGYGIEYFAGTTTVSVNGSEVYAIYKHTEKRGLELAKYWI